MDNTMNITTEEYRCLVASETRLNLLIEQRLLDIKESNYVSINSSDHILGPAVIQAIQDRRKELSL